MKINIDSLEMYVYDFGNGNISLSTKVSHKDKETEEYINKYINIYLSKDYPNKDKVVSRLATIQKGTYLPCTEVVGELIGKGENDICIILSSCKFGKPIAFGSKKKATTTKTTSKTSKKEEVNDDDLPF